MSDEAALLAAILAHPDEDTPRLMYADWLDEHGQPERAEFIRIQCDATADEAAEDRVAELEERNRVKWLAGLPQFPEAHWHFRRGFPEYLDAAGGLFLHRYEAFARVPWLRFLSLSEVDNTTVRDFVNRPWSPRWAELELEEDPWASYQLGYDGAPGIIALATSPQVAQLRRLELHLYTLSQAANDALASLRQRFGDRLVIG
jgi:uncharacterized protein (TIGR02996 family)